MFILTISFIYANNTIRQSTTSGRVVPTVFCALDRVGTQPRNKRDNFNSATVLYPECVNVHFETFFKFYILIYF